MTGVGQFRPIISSNLAAHPLFETLAAHSSVGKVNDQFRLAFPRERLGGELSFLPGGEVPKLLPMLPRTIQSSKLSSGTM